MDFKKEWITCERARNFDLLVYLSKLGFVPIKIKGDDHWFLSPFREESTASFKVNAKLNRWYDFGEGAGGNLVDFGIRYFQCSVYEFMNKINGGFSFHKPFVNTRTNRIPDVKNSLDILEVKELTAPSLLRYIALRKIDILLAKEYCKQVHFSNNGKRYFAIGFPNQSGGFELRNAFFKGGNSPKDITHVTNGKPLLCVFEGFFDFLSYLTFYSSAPASEDFLILNSLSFFERAMPIMQAYQAANLFLDNNPSGRKSTALALSTNKDFKDRCSLYKDHEDLNDFLCNIDCIKDNLDQFHPP